MEPGFMAEGAPPGYGRWVPGELQVGPFGNAKVAGKPRWEVRAYRCTSCSHLYLYAVDPGY